jgi:hypothetical protein
MTAPGDRSLNRYSLINPRTHTSLCSAWWYPFLNKIFLLTTPPYIGYDQDVGGASRRLAKGARVCVGVWDVALGSACAVWVGPCPPSPSPAPSPPPDLATPPLGLAPMDPSKILGTPHFSTCLCEKTLATFFLPARPECGVPDSLVRGLSHIASPWSWRRLTELARGPLICLAFRAHRFTVLCSILRTTSILVG